MAFKFYYSGYYDNGLNDSSETFLTSHRLVIKCHHLSLLQNKTLGFPFTPVTRTWIKEKSMMTGSVQQNRVYTHRIGFIVAQYLALWPMLSWRPSPAMAKVCPVAFSLVIVSCWYFFQYKWMVGNNLFLKKHLSKQIKNLSSFYRRLHGHLDKYSTQ